MKSDEIQSLFATKLKTYAPIEGQPLDPDLSALRETLTAILLPIAYDGEKGIHNLVVLIHDEDAYKSRHGANFPTPPHSRQSTMSIYQLMHQMPCGSDASQPTPPRRKITNCLPPPITRRAISLSPSLKICGCANYATPIYYTWPSIPKT